MALFLLTEEFSDSLNRRREKRDRIYRSPLISAFSLHEIEFVHLFRLPQAQVRKLCIDLRQELQPISTVRTALSVETKVLCALRFYASGSYQRGIGQNLTLTLSQSSVSQSVVNVSKAINKVLFHSTVHFPHRNEYAKIKRGFAAAGGFPGIIGAIDCTHVAIVAPPQNDPLHMQQDYMNRKSFYSINVQLVCDADLLILNVNARYPGSSHDAFIWRNSVLRQFLVDDFANHNCDGWLIGDQGYPLEPWLLVPFKNPQSAAQAAYNQNHTRTRNVIERCNGVLKSRFRCLLRHRVLHYHPTTASAIINACVVLHNVCIECKVDLPENDLNGDVDQSLDVDDPPVESAHTTSTQRTAIAQRNQIVQNHFT